MVSAKSQELLTAARQAAAERFSPDRYDRFTGVVEFAENQVTKDGEPHKFTRADLQKIADRCNERIADTGDFCPLIEGHTDDTSESEKPALGYSGPFRLAKIGKRKPRWAIVADEYHKKEHSGKLKDLPRRSAEVWLTEDEDERFIDPIAALGGTTPELNLGLAYRFGEVNGRSAYTLRYRADAVAASGNTFVPSADIKKPKKHALGNEETRSVLEALNSLDWVQWVKGKMAAEEMAEQHDLPDGGVDAETSDSEEDEMAKQYKHDPDEYPMPDDENENDEHGNYRDMHRRYQAGEDMTDEEKDDLMQYMARYMAKRYQAEEDQGEEEDEEVVSVAKMSRTRTADQVKYAKLQREHDALQQRVAQIEAARVDAVRDRDLADLAQVFQMDVDAERKRCLFSKGSQMSNDGFEAHKALIAENYRPLPVGETVPMLRFAAEPDTPMTPGDRDEYEKKLAAAVERIVQENIASRKPGEKRLTYQMARQKAVEEIEGKKATA